MAEGPSAQDSAKILNLILKCLPAFVVAADTDLRFTLIRGKILEEIGLDEAALAALIGTRAEAFFRGPDGESILQRGREALGGVSTSLESGWNGRWYNTHVAPIRDDGSIVGVVAVGIDITPRHRLAEQLQRERQLLEDAQLLAEVGSWVLDVRTGEVQLSAQLARLLGVPHRAEAIPWTDLLESFSPSELQLIETEKQRALRTCGSYDFDHDIVRPDGSVRHVRSRGHVDCDSEDKPLRCIGTMIDITERVEAQRAAEMLAYHDPLTGLPNRWLLQDRLQTALASARRERQNVYAVFIDLDDFKRINDSLGHAVGDVLLAEVGQRLHSAARTSDTVARMGGDEFLIVLTHIETDDQLQAALDKIRAAFDVPFRLAGADYPITASLGVAGYPADASNVSDLLRDADAAMYEAKQKGRDAVARYTTTSLSSSKERVRLEVDMRRAMHEHEFEVHYQPIVNALTMKTAAVEALLRWRHPSHGLLFPASFLHIIERTDYVNAVGEWVLAEACEQVARWRNELNVPLRLSVNVAARQLQRNNLPATLNKTLRESGLNADAIDIELTENTVVHDFELATKTLSALRDLGVGVAIDDFGTGYNSLSYLKHFPITALKIDRSFVTEMDVDAFDGAISSAVVALGKALRIRVVAEGVEHRAQLDTLLALGCDEVQGNFFAPAMEASQITRRLALEAAG